MCVAIKLEIPLHFPLHTNLYSINLNGFVAAMRYPRKSNANQWHSRGSDKIITVAVANNLKVQEVFNEEEELFFLCDCDQAILCAIFNL